MDFYAATASRYYAPVALGIWCANWEMGCEALGLRGHFAALPAEARGTPASRDIPHYDVSWIADGTGAGRSPSAPEDRAGDVAGTRRGRLATSPRKRLAVRRRARPRAAQRP
jgi:hypothetical protein